MKKILLLAMVLFVGQSLIAQQIVELTDPKPHDGEAVWNRMTTPTQLSWGTTDVRYPKHNVPAINNTSLWKTKAWKGERVHAQAVLWTKAGLEDVSIQVSDLKSGSKMIAASAISTHFVRYVMTDELNKDGKGGCGYRENKTLWDSSLVADALDIIKSKEVQAFTVQPIWMSIRVPADAQAGKYKGTLSVTSKNGRPLVLPFEVEVLNRELTAPKDWAFHLDLWQNPYAVARFYQVPLWSREHFDAMLPIMKMLADAGQRAITTSIMHKPWAGQTEDPYDSMIFRMKKMDGSWVYDYTVFDKWVEFMMNEVGIKDMISCYTMIPWSLSFDYFDQATNRVLFLEAKPGEPAYTEYWGTFLKDFARHLRSKGWFDITAISMDERPMESMREAIRVIKEADPAFKITLAGGYHAEIQEDLYYLAIPYRNFFPADVKAERERRGQISALYTCCSEAFPNIFTFSAPAEAPWTVLHALAAGYDGYLRWAVNSWPANPLQDSRFRTWAAGDTYSIYPGPRSSIRFERLVEGLQACEKIRLLRDEFSAKGATAKLDKLNRMVARFASVEEPTEEVVAATVSELYLLLNAL